MIMEKKTIRIGNPYIKKEMDDLVRLCADVTIQGKTVSLWYGVERRYEDALTKDRSDPFAVALINIAMLLGADIICDSPVSRRLLYKINHSFIPALCFVSDELSEIKVIAEPAESCGSQGAIGCSCSFGLDSFYTILKNRDGEYPITHLCLFNSGTFEGENSRRLFRRHYGMVKDYAEKHGLDPLFVDTNLHEVLEERYMSIVTIRQLSIVLALQGLFKAYLYSSGRPETELFIMDPYEGSSYDPLSVDCFSTDSLRIFLSGIPFGRPDKLHFIADHPEEAAMIHPCFRNPVWEKNCGKCRKCSRDMLMIYADGMTDRFSEAFDFGGFEKKIPTFLASAMVMGDELNLGTLKYWTQKGLPIPKKTYVYAERFRAAMKNLEENGA